MLFSGGLIPSYIVNTQYLKLDDTIWIYLLSGLCSAWYIIIMRTFFQQLPVELIESAKIDGAGEMRIFFTIIAPLSKPVLATIALFCLLGKWNEWMLTLIYIRNEKLYTSFLLLFFSCRFLIVSRLKIIPRNLLILAVVSKGS
jgi:ABC-type glycerol-3-phosphate transport system permease component